jgi:hypothetical protein
MQQDQKKSRQPNLFVQKGKKYLFYYSSKHFVIKEGIVKFRSPKYYPYVPSFTQKRG